MQHFEHTIHGDEDTIIAPFFSFISFHTIYTLLTQESLLLLLPSEALDVVCLMVYVLHTVAGGSDMGPRGGQGSSNTWPNGNKSIFNKHTVKVCVSFS